MTILRRRNMLVSTIKLDNVPKRSIMEIQHLIDNLARKGFKPKYFDSQKDAVDFVLDLIPTNASIGIGGSMTIKQLGLDNKLFERGNVVYSHSLVAEEQRDKVYQLAASADWYLSSTNALSESGDLVNIDGAANRISSLAFGVKNILYVLGVNKIAPDVQSAIDRVRNVAAPPNAKRLNKNTPCAKVGKCCLCNSPDCIWKMARIGS